MQPIRWGRIYFLPAVAVSYGWDNNVYRLSEEDPGVGPIESGIGDIQPLLRFELPYRKSLIRLVYRGDYRTYSSEILKGAGGMSNAVDFGGHFEVGQRVRIDGSVNYADTITAMLNSAPGGEYRYGTQPVETKEAQISTAVDLGSIQSVELGAARGEVHFPESVTSAAFNDNSFQNLYFHYVLNGGPQNQVYLSLDRQDRQQNGVNPLLQPPEYSIRSVGAGFRRVTGRDLTSEVRVAYTSTDFPEGLTTPYRGITLEGIINLAPSPLTQLQLKLRRGPQVSFFNVSAYYVNDAIEFNFNRLLSRVLALRLVLGTQRNNYSDPIQVTLSEPGGDLDQNENGLIDGYENLLPSEGETRQDRITNASLSVLWHASRSMDLSLGYIQQQARSNVEAQGPDSLYSIYDYDGHAVLLSAILGWQ